MNTKIRSPAQMTEEARVYLTTVETVNSRELREAIGIGQPFADKLLGQFEQEGLISGPDRRYRHNVRSSTGDLTAPATRPRRTWEDYALSFMTKVAKARGRDDGI